jgi:hypothetical protein
MKKLTISSLMIFFFVVGMTRISSAIPVTAETLADGIFLSPRHQWNEYVMFWDTDSVCNQGSCIMLDLGGILNFDTSHSGIPVLFGPYDNAGSYSPNTLIHTDRSSDSEQNFSVSEIQVDGSKVPEPATVLLFGIGLTGLSRIRSRGNFSQ